MSERAEVTALFTVGALCSAGAVTAWCVSPWWAALLVSVPLVVFAVAAFGMAWREGAR